MRRDSSSGTALVELSESQRDVIAHREQALVALESALAAVNEANFESSVQRVAETLPLAVGVEAVVVRLLAHDDDALYLVAHEGFSVQRVRDLALDPFPLARQRSMFSLGRHHSHAQKLGLRYLSGEWLRSGSDPIGSLQVGCRTDRRPAPAERDELREAALTLGRHLAQVDRSRKRLRNRSLAIARAATLEPEGAPHGVLSVLRPREATVLELYATGRSVEEIAAVLVISPHTVRTHIKLAFRRLEIHSREEAAKLVRANEIVALV